MHDELAAAAVRRLPAIMPIWQLADCAFPAIVQGPQVPLDGGGDGGGVGGSGGRGAGDGGGGDGLGKLYVHELENPPSEVQRAPAGRPLQAAQVPAEEPPQPDLK